MSKFGSYTAIAAAGLASDDLLVIKDTSATATKKLPLSDVLQGALLVSTATAIVASNVLSFGANLATNPVFQLDFNTASVATGWKITGAAATARVALAVVSSGTNEGGDIDSKGSGTLRLNATATGNVVIGTNLQLGSTKAIVDANGNEILLTPATVASAVNEVTVTNAATGNPPTLSATGGDTNVSLKLSPKGTGVVTADAGIVSTDPTDGLGYATGAGGTVSQATSRTTGVTLNKVAGAITLFSAANSATPATFTVTNSAVAATDVVVVSQKSGTDPLSVSVTNVSAGSFKITLYALSGTTTEAPVLNFAVVKGATS